MASRLRIFGPWLVALALLIGAAAPRGAVADDLALAVIVHRSNRMTSITPHMLKQVFTARLLFWPDGAPVIALNYPPGNRMRTSFDGAVLGMTPNRVGEFWVDQLVRARARPPRKLPNPRLVLRVVSQLRGSVGYVPEDRVSADVNVLALVRNGKVVSK